MRRYQKYKMSYILMFSIIISFLIIQIVSISSFIFIISHADPETRSPANWTVMNYMAGDNDLRNAAIDDLNEMEAIGSSADVNIIALLDGNVDGDTKLYYVKKDPNGYYNTIVSEELSADWLENELNMGDPNVLVSFVNWTIANYPAEHYYLNIWSHGDGWQTGEDWSQNNDLRTYELKYAFSKIKEASNGLQLDIVGFDACRMGLLEVDYQLVDYADIAIGSEKDVEWDGLPYERILGGLASNPSMTPANFSKKIVNEYIDSYKVGSVPGGGYAITLSAVDLHELNNTLNPAFEEFSNELRTSMPHFKSQISALRAQTEKYEGDQFFDLYHFAQLTTKRTDISLEIKTAAENLMYAIEKTVIAENHWNPTNPKQGYANNAHGISIYFDDIDLHPDYRGFIMSERTLWDDFLDRFYSDGAKPSVSLEADANAFDDDEVVGNESVKIAFETNVTALNLTLNIYDSVGKHVITLFNQSTLEGIQGEFFFNIYDFCETSDYYTCSLNLRDSSGILQNHRELCDVWLGNSKPDVSVSNLTFYRQDGVQVGGNSGKHPIENETTTITASIRNEGNENLSDFDVILYDDSDQKSQMMMSLIIGEEKGIKFNWIGTTGRHEIKIMADTNNSFREVDETNNEVSEDIEVKSTYPEKSIVIEGRVITNKNQTVSGARVVVINERTQESFEEVVENSSFTVIVYPSQYLNGDKLTVRVIYKEMEEEESFSAYSDDLKKNLLFEFDIKSEPDNSLGLYVIGVFSLVTLGFLLVRFLTWRRSK